MDVRLLRATEVAEVLGVSRATAYSLMAAGILPTVRIGRSVRCPDADLKRWVAENTARPAATTDVN